MSRRLFAFMVLLLLPRMALGHQDELNAISQQLVQRLPGEPTVAVVDFRNLEGDVTKLGRFVAEEVSVFLLAASDDLKLFDRGNLTTLLEEIQLSEDGAVTAETAKELQLAGVDILVTGRLTRLGDSLRLSIKALDTSTARVVAAANGNLPLTEELAVLAGRSIRQKAPGSHGQLGLPGAKTEGPFRISLIDFKVLKEGRLAATYGVYNADTDTPFMIGIASRHDATATDDLGNSYAFDGGLEGISSDSRGRARDRARGREGLQINPGQTSEFTLYFEVTQATQWRSRTRGEPGVNRPAGTRFTLTTTFVRENARTDDIEKFGVTFLDVYFKREE